eukprot:scaffold65878_cov24-Phaeocystis_antarctica.AAC.1
MGLQPRCMGLQPGCMGLQPECMGLQPRLQRRPAWAAAHGTSSAASGACPPARRSTRGAAQSRWVPWHLVRVGVGVRVRVRVGVGVRVRVRVRVSRVRVRVRLMAHGPWHRCAP